MSYQVLARKWRPQTFSELVGQQHVVDAITNALENDKLHHAYLFTGTRGVGKTTIARIFSKSLNCEQGQSANPCGKCATCQDISDGRYVDLLEIDAASRTKVEDTRELLDNVQYRPTRGKYKVYLIDEVHMLSKHSFNALLKTLEEPPEHVKFLLATTDPQKLPVTILSRCLQFSLKALTKEQIQAHLAFILGQEKIPYEDLALAQLARAAQGSIRDSLSLTDQAIAQGNNQVSLAIVSNMLGLLNKNQVLKLVKFICERDSTKALTQLNDICSESPDYFQVLSQVLALLHQIALTQVVPEVCKLDAESAKGVYTLAKSLSKEHVQILYQIGINGKRDLPHAPDPRSGLQMTVLRMLAFSPAQKIDLDIDALISEESELPTFESMQKPSPTVTQAIAQTAVLTVKQDDVLPIQTKERLLESGSEIDIEKAVSVAPEVGKENSQANEKRDSQFYAKEVSDTVAVTTDQTKPELSIEPQQAPSADKVTSTVVEQIAKVSAVNSQVKSPIQNNAQIDNTKIMHSGVTDEQPPFYDEEPPLPDEEPLMFDDMFADQPMSDESDQSYESNVHNKQSPQVSQASDNSQSGSHVDKTQIDQTLALLKASQQLNEFTAEKEGENDAKKPEADTQPTQAVVAKSAYQLGHKFAAFSGDLPAYLDNKEKLTSAAQVDEWSAFVDATQILALARQLLVHANCTILSNPLELHIPEQIKHLCDEAILNKIQEQLSEQLQEAMVINVSYEKTENTPFQIQTRIDNMRQEYAYEVVNTDTSIQELIKAFDASVIENSVEAR